MSNVSYLTYNGLKQCVFAFFILFLLLLHFFYLLDCECVHFVCYKKKRLLFSRLEQINKSNGHLLIFMFYRCIAIGFHATKYTQINIKNTDKNKYLQHFFVLRLIFHTIFCFFSYKYSIFYQIEWHTTAHCTEILLQATTLMLKAKISSIQLCISIDFE